MSQWPATKARRVLAALLRIGWNIKRQSGRSHRVLLAFLKQMVEMSIFWDTIINDSFNEGQATVADVKRSEQFKLEMKILMLRTKGE